MKTLHQWLDTLPEPYKSQAINNARSHGHDSWLDCNTFTDGRHALFSAFAWNRSPQGYEYWNNVYNNYIQTIEREYEKQKSFKFNEQPFKIQMLIFAIVFAFVCGIGLLICHLLYVNGIINPYLAH